ncbi:MAG TPA: acyltransferase family protein, partial [Trueperaceae bacterium]|nr:acyltransferase family protein [Trueperaceae bacterium]
MAFRADIEGVRGIAVLLVVLFHAGIPYFTGGFVGVDVFFVLSGYLITRLLVDEAAATGRIDLVAFYARRARRLLPAAALMIIVTLLFGWLVLAPITLRGLAASAGTAATYWSNLYFALSAGDYFGPDLATNPFLHTWSLAVEEQFYLVWPLLVLFAVWLAKRWRPGLLAVLLAATLVSFALNLWTTEHLREWAFFSSPTRAWQFGAGAIAGLFSTRGVVSASRWGGALGWLGLAALLASAVGLSEALPWPGYLALAPTLGTVLVLHSGVLAPSARLQSLLATVPLQFLGRLSYTWYLWHWPALVLSRAALGPMTVPARLAVALASLGLSWVTYNLIEKPLRFHPRLLPAPRRSLVVMVTLSLLAAGAATATRVFSVMSDRQERYLAAMDDISSSSADGCNLSFTASEPAQHCVYGVLDSSIDVVLIGDSHATMWFPALEQLARYRGWRLVVHAKSSCGLEDGPATRSNGAP